MTPTLEQFVEELKMQDNAGTARPLIIELQEKRIVFVDPRNGSDESSKAKDCPHLTESPEDLGLDPEEELYWKEEWVGVAWFLTHSGLEEHLRLNRHNYRETRPFIKHAFRSPEAVRVYEWLAEAAELKQENANQIKIIEQLVKTLRHIGKRDLACSPCNGRCPDEDEVEHLREEAKSVLKKTKLNDEYNSHISKVQRMNRKIQACDDQAGKR